MKPHESPRIKEKSIRGDSGDSWPVWNRGQGLKYLKIGTCPASQKLLAYRGKKLIYTRNIKIFTCPAARGTRKYERTSAIFEAWGYYKGHMDRT